MNVGFGKNQIAIAVAAALSAGAIIAVPTASAAGKTPGKYVAGDFHNHTTCSDGAISMQKLVKKATDKVDTPWGLDWFVQAGHGGNGNRNCTLVEDATLATPAYPLLSGPTPFLASGQPVDPNVPNPTVYAGPSTTWASTVGVAGIKGTGTAGINMWRWQTIQEYQYPVMEYLNAYRNVPVFIGMESVVAGHEHTSMSVISGQMPASIDSAPLPTSPGYTAAGNATALAQWSYCFDRGDADTSRGATNQWDCSVPNSPNSTDGTLGWTAAAAKLITPGGTGTGTKGHLKTVEAVKWMAAYHPKASYYVPAHLERAGPFNPDGNNGFNVESLRDFNNASPDVAFGFESQPGHGASANRGEYQVGRQVINGVTTDSVGGTTFGGTGVYAAQIGGVWDALLGEGRRFWFFASSDWHNRGSFGTDDRRSTQDFYPGEYQRNYTMVRNDTDKLRPQTIVDGLRTGNNFASSGQLIDRLAFIACVSTPTAPRSNAAVEALAVTAATSNTDIDVAGCATMGEKLKVRANSEIVVSVVVRDPAGLNYSPYGFPNPSLMQIGVNQPLNAPVLDHIDLIRGMVTGFRTPGAPNYSGTWPINTAWLAADGSTPANLDGVPEAAKNTSAALLRTFNGSGENAWTPAGSDGTFLKMTYRIPAVSASQYVRLRGTNLPASVPFETDASGNPLADVFTNASNPTRLRIPCTSPKATNDTGPAGAAIVIPQGSAPINGCPAHLTKVTVGTTETSYVTFDVAAWSDLWFYSNPIYVEVTGSTPVAGIK